MKNETLKHYIKFLEKPLQKLNESSGVEIWLWQDAESNDIRIISTIGMSQNIQHVPNGESCISKNPRTELLSFTYAEQVTVFQELLLDLAAYPFKRNSFLFWWQTLPLGRYVLSGSTLNALLLTMPPFESDQCTFYINSNRVDIIWVVPISTSELEYCKLHGIEALEEAFENTNIDIADLFRQPVI